MDIQLLTVASYAPEYERDQAVAGPSSLTAGVGIGY